MWAPICVNIYSHSVAGGFLYLCAALKNILLLFGVMLASTTFAQVRVSGQVLDESSEAVPYAAVALYNTADSALVVGGATNENGAFTIEAAEGNYYLQVSFLSYEKKTISNISVAKKPVSVGTIQLTASAVALDAVEITAEKSSIELKLDKRIFNVGKDLANTGATASEVLDNVPSVTVDVEGNVSLRGSQNVRILIDGNPSGLIGSSPADALRQLPGNLIERVEVITNPSARYDAEGEVGIINIVLKKEKRSGVNGSFDAITGYPANHSLALNLNYRTKHFNIFTSTGINYRKGPGGGWNNTEFTGDTTYYFESIRTHARGGFGQNFRLGSDFFLSKFNTLTLSGLYNGSRGLNDAFVEYNDFNADRDLLQTITRTEVEEETKFTLEGDLRYRKTFAEKDREWTTHVRYYQKEDNELGDLTETNTSTTADILQRTTNREDEESFLFQTDYVDPFGKKGKWETGVKASLRTINNDYLVETRPTDGQDWTTFRDFDNQFEYTENIYAAYAMAGNETKRFSYQGGLRLEYTDLKTELFKTGETNPRTFLNLFPSLHLGWKLDTASTLQVSYSRRVSRPGFWNLIPFTGFSDSRVFWSGNPDLNPEFTHSFEAGHLYQKDVGSILSSVYYRHRTDVAQRITAIDSSGFSRMFPVNVGIRKSIGMEANVTYEPIKWFRLTGNVNLFYERQEGQYENIVLDAESYTMNIRSAARFKVSKRTDWQASVNYRAPRNRAQGRTQSMTGVDSGISTKVLKRKGTLSANVRDLFNSRKRRGETFGPNFYQIGEYQWRQRQFTLSFNYRLGETKGGGGPKGRPKH